MKVMINRPAASIDVNKMATRADSLIPIKRIKDNIIINEIDDKNLGTSHITLK